MVKLICYMDDYLISKYLDDELSSTERAQFDARLKTDAAFRKEVEAMEAVHRILSEFSTFPAPERLEQKIMQQVAEGFNPMLRFVQWIVITWAFLTLVLLVLKFTGLVAFSDQVSGLDVKSLLDGWQHYQSIFGMIFSVTFTLFILYFSQNWLKKLAHQLPKSTH